MAWLSTAIGKPIADDAREREARMNVYFECLGDLPLQAFQIAAKRCAMERKYQSFPPIAELRELAVASMAGEVQPMTAGEAWGIAIKACGSCDVEVEGSVERAFAKVPVLVNEAIQAFGFRALYTLTDNIETARAQFMRIYEGLVAREQRRKLLPLALENQLAAIGQQRQIMKLPAPEPGPAADQVRKLASSIGAEIT